MAVQQTPSTLTAEIKGSRCVHPRFGASSDIVVTLSDGQDCGPFAYYADAYDHATQCLGILPENVTRAGKRARRPSRR